MGNRQVVERWTRTMAEDDIDSRVALLHPEYEGRYPQSGEVIRGRDAYRAVTEGYPGRKAAPITVTVAAIQSADDQFVARASWPAWTVVHLSGSDDEFTVAGPIHYPNGKTWHAVATLTLKDGKIWRETDYFAAPFHAPSGRRPFVEVERADGSSGSDVTLVRANLTSPVEPLHFRDLGAVRALWHNAGRVIRSL